MKFLFDQNLSPRLVEALGDLYPGSAQVKHFGLHHAEDEAVWDYSREHDFVIVPKDSDFRQRSFLFGFPPKGYLDSGGERLDIRHCRDLAATPHRYPEILRQCRRSLSDFVLS